MNIEMDLTMKISLVSSASITVITNMWYKEKVIRILLNKTNEFGHIDKEKIKNSWQDSENNVIKDLNQLPIPKKSKSVLVNLVHPIGLELKKWLELHKYIFPITHSVPELLVWNVPGVVNMKQTAEKIIANVFLDPQVLLILSCSNCLESQVRLAWSQLQRLYFNASLALVCSILSAEVMIWACYLDNKQDMLIEQAKHDLCNDFMKAAFWVSVENNNAVAAKYFSKEIEEQVLSRIVKILNIAGKHFLSRDTSLFVFLLSKLSKSDQNELFHTQPENVLRHFLNWPLQFFFLELANKLWSSLSAIAFYNVIEEIARKVSENHGAQMYYEIFTGFWEAAPLHFKNYVIHKCINGTIICRIFSFQKTDDVITFLLKAMTREQRLNMLLGFNGMLALDHLVIKGKRESLMLLISKCAISKYELIQLKISYLEHICDKHKNSCGQLAINDAQIEFFSEVLESVSNRCPR